MNTQNIIKTINSLKGTKIVYKYAAKWTRLNPVYSDSVRLSSSEIEYISDHVKIGNFKWISDLIWTSDLLGNNTQINSASNILASNWSSPGHGFFELSAPIFFRNNTMCIFYFGHYEGPEAGEGVFALYIKEETGWQLFGKLFKWVS